MTQKVVTKKSFIGGRLVYPGEAVDVDAKGAVLPAASTPIGNLTVEQLRDLLAAKESETGEQPEVFGKNVADHADLNTGAQALETARITPGTGNRPQVIPAGTEEHNGGFVHPAPADAPAAIEEVVAPGAGEEVERDPLDHDGDGRKGGSKPKAK